MKHRTKSPPRRRKPAPRKRKLWFLIKVAHTARGPVSYPAPILRYEKGAVGIEEAGRISGWGPEQAAIFHENLLDPTKLKKLIAAIKAGPKEGAQ